MGKTFKERTKNVLRRTLFTRMDNEATYQMLASAPITFRRAKEIVDNIAAANTQVPVGGLNARVITDQEFKDSVATFTNLMNAQVDYLQDIAIGRSAVIGTMINTVGAAVGSMRTYASYETDRLKHVLDYVPNPQIKKITLKGQLYNPVIVYRLKVGDAGECALANKRFVYFLDMLSAYNRYMTALSEQILKSEYIEVGTEGIDAVKWPKVIRVRTTDDIRNNRINYMIEEQEPGPGVGANQQTYRIHPRDGVMANSVAQPGPWEPNSARKRNEQIMPYLLQIKKRNFKQFKKELVANFGKDIQVYDSYFKVKVTNQVKYQYICIPMIDPMLSEFNIAQGCDKYIQTVVTYDTEGCEAALATYSKKMIKNAYVILKDGKIKNRIKLKKYGKYKKKYKSKYLSMYSKKRFGKSAYKKAYKKKRYGAKKYGYSQYKGKDTKHKAK